MTTQQFPEWEKYYQENAVEGMPWFNPELDTDLKAALKALHITSGRFLDLGTGPGTQAIELAKLGFEVTGSDLSQTAIEKAKQKSSSVHFVQDDILHSNLKESFDYVFDRGCFHTISPEDRARYQQVLTRLVRPGGILFLKTFSQLQEAWDYGPYRFARSDIEQIFKGPFELESSIETVYQGTLEKLPKALFCILRRSAS